MTNSNTAPQQDPFADFDDDLAEVYRTGGKTTPREKTFREKCPKCKGTGVWTSYTGFSRGECFSCKGKGFHEFATSPEQRQKARRRSQESKAKKAALKAALGREWLEANPEHAKWITDATRRGFGFASSMLDAIMTYGQPTEGQLAAIEKCMARDAERQAEREAQQRLNAERAAPVANTAILDAMLRAREEGKKWVKLQYSGLLFKLGAAGGRNAEAIWVTDTDGEFLGGVKDGQFTPRRECSDDQRQQVLTILEDPAKAARVYGLQTGRCSCCGRELTNKASIAAGIGPICAERFGF